MSGGAGESATDVPEGLGRKAAVGPVVRVGLVVFVVPWLVVLFYWCSGRDLGRGDLSGPMALVTILTGVVSLAVSWRRSPEFRIAVVLLSTGWSAIFAGCWWIFEIVTAGTFGPD